MNFSLFKNPLSCVRNNCNAVAMEMSTAAFSNSRRISVRIAAIVKSTLLEFLSSDNCKMCLHYRLGRTVVSIYVDFVFKHQILAQALRSPCFEATNIEYNLIYTDQSDVVRRVASDQGGSTLGLVDMHSSFLFAPLASFPFATNKLEVLFNLGLKPNTFPLCVYLLS